MKPRILLLDIETQPDVAYVWGAYEQNAIEIKEHWQMLSFAAAWLGHKPFVRAICDYKGYKAGDSDRKLCKELWGLLNEADIVVAHNGADFDVRKINARMIAHGMTPPSPYHIIDTKRTVKRVAAFSSNKLDWLCSQLDIGRKIEHEGFAMWKGCMAGEKRWWKKMKKYNLHDVRLLQELYLEVAPWIKQPNANAYSLEVVCPNPACGSQDLSAEGVRRSKTRTYQRFRCKKCGAWAQAVRSERGSAKVMGV